MKKHTGKQICKNHGCTNMATIGSFCATCYALFTLGEVRPKGHSTLHNIVRNAHRLDAMIQAIQEQNSKRFSERWKRFWTKVEEAQPNVE